MHYTVPMEKLFEYFYQRIQHTDLTIIRNFETMVPWNERLIGIKGSRGCGKTTLLLQHIKKHFTEKLDEVLYVSLDNIWFADNHLIELADYFAKRGGTYLFLDEVHKYPDWSVEIKNIYDEYPSLNIVFTGSSLLEILKARADLSRRALVFEMNGLSFREFLEIETGNSFPVYSLDDILINHTMLAQAIVSKVKPLAFFEQYLEHGFYPYYLEGTTFYSQRLGETINMILEQELPALRSIEPSYVPKLKQLLAIIAESAPFLPNIKKLSERIGINRQTFINYLHFLEQAKIIHLLYRETRGIGLLQKPDKIFLENTNLMHVLGSRTPSVGNIRETFIISQLKTAAEVHYAQQGDFLINRSVSIEVGGRNKTREQLKGLSEAYIAADNIEYGYDKKIPLWLFGFLY